MNLGLISSHVSSRARSFLLIIIETILFCLFPFVSFALVVTDDITTDTVWSIADSPVTVADDDFIIGSGANVFVEPGVTVLFAGKVTVYGSLTALGTAEAPITFDALDSSFGWGNIAFTRTDCQQAHEISEMSFVDFVGMNSGFKVDRQSVSVSDSTFDIQTASATGISTYNDKSASCPGASALFVFERNAVNFVTENSDAEAYAVLLHGMDSLFTDNDFFAIFSNSAYKTFAVKMKAGSTAQPASITFERNSFTAEASHDLSDFLYGVNIESSQITNPLKNNVFNLNGAHEIYGITSYNNNLEYNKIVAVSTGSDSSVERDVLGIYSLSTNPATRLRGNHIILQSDMDRALTGVLFRGGDFRNNRVICELFGESGFIIGINQQYYSAKIINNSMRLYAAPWITVYGIYLSYSPVGTQLFIRNNIFAGNGGADSQAIYKSKNYAGTVDSGYNLFYNFPRTYNGIAPGIGDIYADPLFSDPYELTLDPNSPAIDMGDWTDDFSGEGDDSGGRIDIGAFGNTGGAGPSQGFAAPEILTNGGVNFETTDPLLTLTGKTSLATATLFVNGAETGVTYTSGQSAWSFTTELKPGKNIFSAHAVSGSGETSASDTIEVTLIDLTPPEVVSVAPAVAATGVLTSSPITVSFSEAVDPAATAAAFSIFPAISGSVSISGSTLTFTPSSALAYGTVYNVTVSTAASDLSGNFMTTAYSWSFTTENAPPPPPPPPVEEEDDDGICYKNKGSLHGKGLKKGHCKDKREKAGPRLEIKVRKK